jgi:hypothetical protein
MKISRVVLAVPAVLLVAACGAGAGESMSRNADGQAPAAASAPEVADSAGTADASYAVDGKAVESDGVAQEKAVISKGQVSLHTTKIDKARFELQKLLDQWGGEIANEESNADEKGRTDNARFELRIPVKHFDEAMTELAGLGTLVDRSRNSEDVTTQVIDTDTRVRSQKLSLARIQALLAEAKSLNQVIAIEEQLAQRQADLDSLEQQQKYLADQTSLATINLYLSVPGEDEADEDDGSFLSGLHTGWDNLGSTLGAILIGLGTVLPFAVVLALIGLVGLGLRRRLSAR